LRSNKEPEAKISLIKQLFYSKAKSEDQKRIGFILNVILFGSFFLSFVLLLRASIDFIALRNQYKGIPIDLILIITLLFLFLFYLSKRGVVSLTAKILLILYFLAATYTLYLYGAELPVGLLVYSFIISLAFILLEKNLAFFSAIIIIFTHFILSYLQSNNLSDPKIYWKVEALNLGDAVTFASIFGIITILSWLFNREIERSLRRARKSETDLKKERDSLEIRVEERTKEIKKIQLEKMEQMAHFAEFGQVATGIFHDLLNPLTATSLNLYQASSLKPEDLQKAKPYIDQALKSTRKVEEFALAINKQIKQQEIIKQFKPYQEAEQVLNIVAYKIRKENVQMKLNGDKNTYLFGNPLKFHRALTNLIVNAIDSYSGLNKTTKSININFQEKNDDLVIEVIDNGMGIKQELLPKIFDPFVTTKQFSAGTGIGLSVVKNTIIRDFLGEIDVKSKLNNGTTFTLKLPIAKHHESKTI
jgi:signal transduction histidine kinase